MAGKVWTAEDLKAYGFSTGQEPEVHSITNAENRHSESIDYRFRSYALKMLLRIIFIMCALFSSGWLMWACIIAAGVLPWVAVVFANGTDRARSGDFSAYLPPHQQRQLDDARQDYGGRAETAGSPYTHSWPTGSFNQPESSIVIEGEVVAGGHYHRPANVPTSSA